MLRYTIKIVPLLLSLTGMALAQGSRTNNPYAPSPGANSVAMSPEQVAIATPPSKQLELRSAPKTVQPSTHANGSLTSIYKIGVGDILYVSLVNTPGANGYYSVRPDGTIDFPVSGDDVVVAGRTAFSAAGVIARAINVYSNPQVEVKVSQYASHKVEVFGLVERSGEKAIQREAVPLYVIKADAEVDPRATRVVIRRSGAKTSESHSLRETSTDDILILPGDSVEFVAG